MSESGELRCSFIVLFKIWFSVPLLQTRKWKWSRVLLYRQRRERTASVGVPKRLCVISAHFRAHSTETHLPCDRGRWEAALTDMERCTLGLRSETETQVQRDRKSFQLHSFRNMIELRQKTNFKISKENVNLHLTSIKKASTQFKASPIRIKHTHSHLLVWRAKGVSGKPWKNNNKTL